MTTLDRWAREVKKQLSKDALGAQYLSPDEAVTLLRQQHRWMVRMVKAVPKAKGYADDLIHRQTILDRLRRRAL